MARASLNITVIPKRMLTNSESADYCGRPVKRFEIECPVSPTKFPNGDLRWCMHDLDTWLDNLKTHSGDIENILARLG